MGASGGPNKLLFLSYAGWRNASETGGQTQRLGLQGRLLPHHNPGYLVAADDDRVTRG